MDVSVLPNNNHPQKFLQLDVGMLPPTHGMFQINADLPQRHWHNQVYSQGKRDAAAEDERARSPHTPAHDGDLEKHIIKPKIKLNPLFSHSSLEQSSHTSSRPSWTLQDCRRHHTHTHLPEAMTALRDDPDELHFWLQDLYTPGFDSLLKKTEAELLRKKRCKTAAAALLLMSAILILVTVPVLLTRA